MALPTPQVDQPTLPPGTPGVSRADGVLAQIVLLTDPANGGAGTFFWELVGLPPGSAVTLLNATTATPTLTALDVYGTYLVRETHDGDVATIAIAVLSPNRNWRIPAFDETVEFGATGWDGDMQVILRDLEASAFGAGGTLDDAYDFGGAGAGSDIEADSGAVNISSEASNVSNVLQIYKTPTTPQAGNGIVVFMLDGATGGGIGISQYGTGHGLFFDGDTTPTRADILFNQATANPTVLVKGSLWFNATDNKLRYYDGTTVQDLPGTGGGAIWVDNAGTYWPGADATHVAVGVDTAFSVFGSFPAKLTLGVQASRYGIAIVGEASSARAGMWFENAFLVGGVTVAGEIRAAVSLSGAGATNNRGVLIYSEAATLSGSVHIQLGGGGGALWSFDHGDAGTLKASGSSTRVQVPILDVRTSGVAFVRTEYIAMRPGTLAAVSEASTGRIRYNDGTQEFEASKNGGAWATFGGGGGGGGTLDDAYDSGGPGAGAVIDADAGAVHILDLGLNGDDLFKVEKSPPSTAAGHGVTVTMGVDATGVGILIRQNGSNHGLAFDSDQTPESADIYFTQAVADPTSLVAGQLWYNATANKLRYYDGTFVQDLPGAGGGGGTLDAAYDFGGAGAGRTIAADSGAVVITSSAANTNNVIEVTKTPAGAQAGAGVLVTMGANATGAGVSVAQSGTSHGLLFTSDTTPTRADIAFTMATADPSTLVEGSLWYNTTANKLRYYDGTTVQDLPGAGGGGGTLDAAYDFGGAGAGRTITADANAVVITTSAADNNDVFQVTKTPAGAQSGAGVLVTMGANTTGAAVSVAQSGTGHGLSFASDTTPTRADILFTQATADPSTPVEGSLWYNTTDNVLRYYDGTTVQDLPGAGGGAGTLAAADFLQTRLSVDYDVTTTAAIPFDTVEASRGSLSINGSGKVSGLKAGRTYLLQASCEAFFTSAATVEYRWFDVTGAVTLGRFARTKTTTHAGDSSTQSVASYVFAPVVDSEVELRVVGFTAGVDIEADTSWLSVIEIGAIPLFEGTATVTSGPYAASLGELIRADPTGGAFTINLPACSLSNKNRWIVVKNFSTSTNTITLDAAGAHTVDGLATLTMNTPREALTLVSDGVSDWTAV